MGVDTDVVFDCDADGTGGICVDGNIVFDVGVGVGVDGDAVVAGCVS